MINNYRFFNDFFDGEIVFDRSNAKFLFSVLTSLIFTILYAFRFLDLFEVLLFISFSALYYFFENNRVISFCFSIYICLCFSIICIKSYLFSLSFTFLTFVPLLFCFYFSKEKDCEMFVQYKKRLTFENSIILICISVLYFILISIFSYYNDLTFWVMDSLLSVLVCAVLLLRIERYFESKILEFLLLFGFGLIFVKFSIKFSIIIFVFAIYNLYEVCNISKNYINEYKLICLKNKINKNNKTISLNLDLYHKYLISNNKNSRNAT